MKFYCDEKLHARQTFSFRERRRKITFIHHLFSARNGTSSRPAVVHARASNGSKRTRVRITEFTGPFRVAIAASVCTRIIGGTDAFAHGHDNRHRACVCVCAGILTPFSPRGGVTLRIRYKMCRSVTTVARFPRERELPVDLAYSPRFTPIFSTVVGRFARPFAPATEMQK